MGLDEIFIHSWYIKELDDFEKILNCDDLFSDITDAISEGNIFLYNCFLIFIEKIKMIMARFLQGCVTDVFFF